MSVLVSLQEAVAEVPDGALITFGGFQLNRAPMALVQELIRQKRRGLRITGPPNPLPLDMLVGAGAVAEAEFGFIGFQYEEGFVVAPNVRRAIEAGTIRWRERDVYEIVQGLRAAAQGVPFLPAPGVEGSEYMERNRTPTVKDPVSGASVPLAVALRPDIALIHVQEADRAGNLFIADRYAEDLQADASVKVVATAEKIVGRVTNPTIPGRRVERLAEAPLGAFPTACYRHYAYSVPHLRDYVERAAAQGVAGSGPAGGDGAPAAAGGGGKAGAARLSGGATQVVDRLLVGLARSIADGDVVATGLASALPMLAIALARRTHAPRLRYINCVGAVNPRVERVHGTSVDCALLERCEGTVTLPEMFDMARRGAIDLMFFGAPQLDREGRMNLTCIGDYARPKIKLPGPAGSASMRAYVGKVVLLVTRHSPRTLVPRVDFVTSAPAPRNRETRVVTDLGLLRMEGGRLVLEGRHEGFGLDAIREATGFGLTGDLETMVPPPTAAERKAIDTLDPDGIRQRLA